MEPGSTDYRRDVGLYALQLARVEWQTGNADAAHLLVQESLKTLDALVKTSPDQPAWQRDLAEAMTERAEQAIATGKPSGEATALLRDALEILEAQLSQNPQERGTVLAAVNARLRLASISADAMRGELAKRSLAAIDMQTSARNDPRLRALQADALRQSGRTAEANAIANALLASGYRAPIFGKATHTAAGSAMR